MRSKAPARGRIPPASERMQGPKTAWQAGSGAWVGLTAIVMPRPYGAVHGRQQTTGGQHKGCPPAGSVPSSTQNPPTLPGHQSAPGVTDRRPPEPRHLHPHRINGLRGGLGQRDHGQATAPACCVLSISPTSHSPLASRGRDRRQEKAKARITARGQGQSGNSTSGRRRRRGYGAKRTGSPSKRRERSHPLTHPQRRNGAAGPCLGIESTGREAIGMMPQSVAGARTPGHRHSPGAEPPRWGGLHAPTASR